MASSSGSNRQLVGVAEQVVASHGRRDVRQLLNRISSSIDEHETRF